MASLFSWLGRLFGRKAEPGYATRSQIQTMLGDMKRDLDGLGRDMDGSLVDVNRRADDLISRREALKRDFVAATEAHESDRAAAVARQISNLKAQIASMEQQQRIADAKVNQVIRLRGLIEQTLIGLQGIAETPDLTATMEVLKRERERLKSGPLAAEFADACGAMIKTLVLLMKDLEIAIGATEAEVGEDVKSLTADIDRETEKELAELLKARTPKVAEAKAAEPAKKEGVDVTAPDFASREIDELHREAKEAPMKKKREKE